MKDFFKKHSGYFLITIVLTVAALLRFLSLGSNPPHLTPDEASLGYNAYSILKTAKDEHGEFLPLIFKSFGDFKPGLYVYLSVPFVWAFGLSEFSVRALSAASGVVSVLLVYLIAGMLFPRKKYLPVVSAFVMAISPWAVHFSRGAWEANLSLALTLAGVLFFLKSLKGSRFLVLSGVFFALTLLAYQGAKLSTALVVFVLFALHFGKIKLMDKKHLLLGIVAAGVIVVPVALSFFQGKTSRLEIFNIFSYSRPTQYVQTILDQGGESVGSLPYFLFHSEGLNFSRWILDNWFNYFSGRFLFFVGDWQNPMHSAPNHGMLLLSDAVLLLVGIFVLLKERFSKSALFVFIWLVVAPTPGVLTRDQIQAVRALNMVVPLVFVLGLGLNGLVEYIQSRKRLKTVLSGALVFVYALSLGYFLDAYFVHLPKHNSMYFKYGYKQVVLEISRVKDRYKAVKVQQSFAQPYIYFLFYEKYDPEKFQSQSNFIESEYEGDVGYVARLDNVEFGNVDFSVDKHTEGYLLVGDGIRLPLSREDEGSYELVGEIRYLNGEVAFRMVATK